MNTQRSLNLSDLATVRLTCTRPSEHNSCACGFVGHGRPWLDSEPR